MPAARRRDSGTFNCHFAELKKNIVRFAIVRVVESCHEIEFLLCAFETFIFVLRIPHVEHQYAIEVMMVSDRNGESSFEIRSFRRSYRSQRLGNLNR